VGEFEEEKFKVWSSERCDACNEDLVSPLELQEGLCFADLFGNYAVGLVENDSYSENA